MASRTTLPDVDPLSQLGIGRDRDQLPSGSPTPERIARRAITPVTPAANGTTAADTPRLRLDVPSAPVAEPQPEATQNRAPKEQGAPTAASAATTGTQPSAASVTRLEPGLLPAKAKTSARVPTDLWEEVRDCVVYFGHRMTLDSFTEEAFREHLKRLRKQHELGQRFPTREHDPKQGRRVL